MAWTRPPDDEPEAPPMATCESRKVYRSIDGREQQVEIKGCGCQVWLVVEPDGEMIELDQKPLSLRRNMVGDWVRAEGEYDFEHQGGYAFVGDPRWVANKRYGKDEAGNETVDWVCGWEWYVDDQPLPGRDVDRPGRVYGNHRLTCKALSLNARKQYMLRDTSPLNADKFPGAPPVPRPDPYTEERERMLSAAIRQADPVQPPPAADNSPRVPVGQCGRQLDWLFSEAMEVASLRERLAKALPKPPERLTCAVRISAVRAAQLAPSPAVQSVDPRQVPMFRPLSEGLEATQDESAHRTTDPCPQGQSDSADGWVGNTR